jgi:hypothetical protein
MKSRFVKWFNQCLIRNTNTTYLLEFLIYYSLVIFLIFFFIKNYFYKNIWLNTSWTNKFPFYLFLNGMSLPNHQSCVLIWRLLFIQDKSVRRYLVHDNICWKRCWYLFYAGYHLWSTRFFFFFFFFYLLLLS